MGCAVRDRNVVFASTFAAFFSRAYDQLRMAAISESNIKLCGSHCGVSIGQTRSYTHTYNVEGKPQSTASVTFDPLLEVARFVLTCTVMSSSPLTLLSVPRF